MTSKLPTILALATLAALPFAAGTAHATPEPCYEGGLEVPCAIPQPATVCGGGVTSIVVGGAEVSCDTPTAPIVDTAPPPIPIPVADSGYVAAGRYFVNPIYVNNPLFVDPATCEHGYYQGSCVSDTLRPTPVHPASDYTYQPAPVAAPVVATAVKALVWLTQVEMLLGNLRTAR